MGLFKFLFGNTESKPKARQSIQPRFEEPPAVDFRQPRYYRILETEPRIVNIWGRDFDFPYYDDSFKTEEGFSLRELLLLVWWGKTKNGRKSSASIPKYFFYDYNINAEKITRKFKENKWIVDDGEKISLTEKGRTIYNKYLKLWEIHSFKIYPVNLDVDFPKWDKNKYEIMAYEKDVEYYSKHAKFCDKVLDYFKSLNCPDFSSEIADQINFYTREKKSDLENVKDRKEKISILKEK